MDIKEIIKIYSSYCDRIVKGGKHYKFYITGTSHMVTVAGTSKNYNSFWEVRRQFRKYGVNIK